MNHTPEIDIWLVVVNPNAGNGIGKKEWDTISSLLSENGLQFSAVFTKNKGHAISLTITGIEDGHRKIIVVGGDGTLNEAVNGVFLNKVCDALDITIAMIPVGTGNDWARMFDIPSDYDKAIRMIKANKRMLHDIGIVKFYEGSSKKERYFINIAGIGFESVVVKRTNDQKEKGRGGKMVYFYNLLMTLISYRNTKAEIIVDNRKISADIFSINIGNGRFCGGGMRQTPEATPDDGLLDVTIINNMGKFEIIRNLGILYNGKILNHPKIDGYKCKKISVSSESVIYAEADGETLGHTPVEFSIIPASINIVYNLKLTK